ncbi:magnesium transporter [Corynebacterium yudongzhengii]|uniref:magnesium and cobalt transport protein CorA n=1 Tax=Corynebacterium yudongzhengii TaxID=2080740 RepID=UPI000D35EB38|nr:magnesium and cobalt transport protein CorA [Corynebacterium yudongzhengii]AWB81924.1 magnesium transporter [Corynebacterium yudongzhengii]
MGATSRSSKLTVPVERAIEHCRIVVDGTRLPGEYHLSSALQEVREYPNGYVWLALREPDDHQMAIVAEKFGIHELIVEDAVTAHQRPKVERYDDQLFAVVRAVRFTDDEQVSDTRDVIATGEIQMIIGADFIITIRHDAVMPLLFDEIDASPELYAHGPAALAWRISDHLVENYRRITALLSREIDEIEEEVFTPGSSFNIDRIYLFKREILEMRHATDPLVEALTGIIKENKDLVPKQVRSYFRDVLDNEMIVRDHIAGFDERLTSLLDASVAKVTLQQNRDMRTISAFVGMAAVPTLIAGIYGMNFTNMPELNSEYGYFIVLGVIVAIMVILFLWFRRNQWL